MISKHSLSLAALLATAATAVAQQPTPTLPFQRTFDLLVFDSTSTTTPPATSDNVYRLSDFNQDGDYYDAGEVLLYYDDLANGDVLNTVTGLACSSTGVAYLCDSSTDIVLALRDLDYDGDANAPGEQTVFFDSANNASGVTMMSATSILVDTLGRVWVQAANSGTPVTGDGIIRLEDLNADGDANDLGEASWFFEMPGSMPTLNVSLPTRFALAPDGAFYYTDITATQTKGVYRVFDADNSGIADSTEFSLWWAPTSLATSPAWYGIALDFAGQVYLANHGGGSTSTKTIHRAFDANLTGAIDIALGEETQVYTWTNGAATFWDLLRLDNGTFLMLDGTADAIYRLTDGNADGDFDDGGEFMMAFDDTSVGLSLDFRAMAVLRAPLLDMSPSAIQLGSATNFVVRTVKPFDLALTAASLSLIPPFPLPPYGNLEIDPFTLILFGSGLSDAQGVFSSPLFFPNDPTLVGSYGCTAMAGDGYRLFLSNGALLTVSPAPTPPTLVINEVDYDQASTDANSYIEIFNNGASPVSLAGIDVRLVNGANSQQYASYSLSSAGATLGVGQYLVIGNSTVTSVLPGSVLAITVSGDFIQNGGPDGIAIIDTSTNTLIDALSYEGSITAAVLTGIPGTFNLVEGTAFPGADTNDNVNALARIPNGGDTNNAVTDWALVQTFTPGAAN
ncbi:MAG: lamin tail domain-containing protein [Planctomycetes bacterium]|nr:lamin tail domain-containing protein [Planctomycetota bacterium]